MELLEFLPGSLYLLSRHAVPSSPSQQETETTTTVVSPLQMTYIHVEVEFPYQNFFLDFGPLHLAHVFAFACRLEAVGKHASRESGDNQHDTEETTVPVDTRVCVVTSMAPQHRANAVCLLGCWAILFLQWTAERAFAPFQHLRLACFHDASPSVDRFALRVLDVLQGLERAVQSGLFPANANDFDVEAFLDDMDPEKLDLSWITPRVAAFAGPQSRGQQQPMDYVEYFLSRGVALVVRLNSLTYEPHIFTREGVDVVDLYFPDGTCPSESIVVRFLALCARTRHAKIAVHCRAGLGRTGTLLACYLMASYHFSAEEAIGWLRLCRPGSVIGSQQHFLKQLEPRIATLAAMASKDPSVVGAGPEDRVLMNGKDEQGHEQNCHAPSITTKGIATRRKHGADVPWHSTPQTAPSPSQPPLLPPKIPGRRMTAGISSGASQGELLLARKHAQRLPLGTSLWPQPTSAKIQ